MRILVYSHSYGEDGAALMLCRAIRYWIEIGWTVDALVTDEVANNFKDQIAHLNITPLKTINFSNYDLILVNTVINLGVIDQLNTSVPIVLWVHEGTAPLMSDNVSFKYIWSIFRKCSQIIFQTEWQYQDVYKSFLLGYPENKVSIVANGIDIPISSKSKKFDSTNLIRVISVGAVIPRKAPVDLALVIESLSKLIHINCEFIGHLGSLDLFDTEQSQYIKSNLPCHIWSNHLSHDLVLNKLLDVDIFCHPSHDETFGLAPLEAAIRRVPVIMANLPPYKYIGWENNINCLTYPTQDLNQLQNQIFRLISEPGLYEKISNGGYELAKNYSNENFFSNITKVMSQVVSQFKTK